jgi:hypothetical protein
MGQLGQLGHPGLGQGHGLRPSVISPKAWCQSLFQHSAFSGLAETAIEREMVPEEIDRPLDMINNVLPSVYRD